ncbi:hypothetical protein [Nostoc sp.]|uniref:hypothetical protein n=1 Tax=Nostoc sp. TaxID=1180 RepID=UPI002FFB5968
MQNTAHSKNFDVPSSEHKLPSSEHQLPSSQRQHAAKILPVLINYGGRTKPQ